LLFIGYINAHSMLQCAKYNKATDECYAVVRAFGVASNQESYKWTASLPICKADLNPWVNPISNYYNNGPNCGYAPCPLPMGTYNQGEQFTMMWYARGHADANGKTVVVYISPPETNSQGSDVSLEVMMQHELCRGPFANCGGQNGATVRCTLDCSIPSDLAAGLYTLWWYWDWGAELYASCADINVIGSSGTATSASATTGASATTASATSTTASATATTAAGGFSTTATATTTTATGGFSTSTTATGFTPRLTTNNNDYALQQGPKAGMCANPAAPNVNGNILFPPKCGTSSPGSRCPDGQCCNQQGNCGPIPGPDGAYRSEINGVYSVITYEEAFSLYCADNQGSWGYIPCSSNDAFALFAPIVLLAVAALVSL